ncbi:MAG: hypothetical protein BWY74_01811 [Firmicutes bacterium ADurb.Bin419]|nr:MAG: hypothetical protein BWY74_01811 [Firmicutes bacterium ADurb.Bin419]
MKGKFLGLMSGILTIVAISLVSTASFWMFYQPKAPKSLHK